MSEDIYSLKLPPSIRAAAERLAKEDGLSFDQWVAFAVAQKIGAADTAADVYRHRARGAKAEDLIEFARNAPDVPPVPGDEID